MGDADLTSMTFGELTPFVEEFRKGAEFVMGSQHAGVLKRERCRGLHRYSHAADNLILNRNLPEQTYQTFIGRDARLTRAAMEKIDLKSESWEYVQRE